jgi:methylenetetrahydrofolate dehydrogenase (NADP+)/methenyltetrahydrofolate cyclohydrolase
MAKIIDGKAYAEGLRGRMAKTVAELKSKHGLTPGLAVVLVGEDPASKVYVANKAKQTVEVGMNSWEHKLDAATPEATLLALVEALNTDVDGFHVVNVGRLSTGQESLVPCTPVGSVMLAKDALGSLAGLEAVVIGRSNIVGKPVAQLLLAENCTVTIAHSKTKDLPAVVRRADLVIAAVGRAEMVKGDWLKPGACVIDVGINRIERDGKGKLVGDCDFASCEKVAGSITPVPGGVGPMTIACLLRNTVRAACAQKGIAIPEL